jgi:hypothetical protein
VFQDLTTPFGQGLLPSIIRRLVNSEPVVMHFVEIKGKTISYERMPDFFVMHVGVSRFSYRLYVYNSFGAFAQ